MNNYGRETYERFFDSEMSIYQPSEYGSYINYIESNLLRDEVARIQAEEEKEKEEREKRRFDAFI